MSASPVVSVIIPCYDCASTIVEPSFGSKTNVSQRVNSGYPDQ